MKFLFYKNVDLYVILKKSFLKSAVVVRDARKSIHENLRMICNNYSKFKE